VVFLRFHVRYLLSRLVTRALRMSVLESGVQLTLRLPFKVLGNPKDDCGVNASVYVVQFNGFMSLIR
jgi:hypothetical protein